MRNLAAVILGTVVLATLLAQGNAEDVKRELEVLLSGTADVVEPAKALAIFIYEVVTLSLKVILSGVNTPGNLNVVLMVASIVDLTKQLVAGTVQLVAFVIGRTLQDLLPSATVNSMVAAVP